jgi:hypothetical protein
MTEKNVDKVRLGKVEVKMGAKSVTLTIDQARELCALLKGLFGDDATKIVHTHDYWYNPPWYVTGPRWQYQGIQWSSNMTTANDANTGTVTYTLNS